VTNDNSNIDETGGIMNGIEEIGASRLSRRSFLKYGLGGGAMLLGGGAVALRSFGSVSAGTNLYVGLAATDGWISLPVSGGTPATAGVLPQVPFFPDQLAPDGQNVYSFGFRDVTSFGANYSDIIQLKNRVQHTAPPMHRGRTNGGSGGWQDFKVGDRITMELWNLGLAMRPDLGDGHTIHWHGFPNQIPYYDGVPETSISVPVGRSFKYEFLPNEAGTYMYHCHFEDVEHVQMGMTGVLFVRPADYNPGAAATKTAYGAGTGSEFDREYTWMITEIDLEEHWLSSHVQQPDWSEYRPDVFLINGRTFPDTLLPSFDNAESVAVALNPALGSVPSRLAYQPTGALVQGMPGEKVLVRIANLGFRSHSLELSGLPMRIVGIDAKPTHEGRESYANGAGGASKNGAFDSDPRAGSSFTTNHLDVAVGSSYDVIIEIPNDATPGDVYPIGARGITGSDSNGGGSMRTHVEVVASLPTQTRPNF
jgi:FtsP/CotA-like multicopper oxidase with cupredoxin domain